MAADDRAATSVPPHPAGAFRPAPVRARQRAACRPPDGGPAAERPQRGEGHRRTRLCTDPSVITNLVGVGLAISVLNKPYGGRFNGRGKAIAALVIAPIWIVVTIALIVIADEVEAERDPSDGTVIEEGQLSPVDLQVGDCLREAVELGVTTTAVDVVPCDTPHQGEVFHVFELPDGPWPGDDEVDRFSDGGCAAAFETFIGITIDLTTLDGISFRPVEESWTQDRQVQCIVTTSEPREGTLEGSGL